MRFKRPENFLSGSNLIIFSSARVFVRKRYAVKCRNSVITHLKQDSWENKHSSKPPTMGQRKPNLHAIEGKFTPKEYELMTRVGSII